LRHRQNRDVDRVARAKRFGRDDFGRWADPKQFAAGQHRNPVGASKRLLRMMGRQ
jgi:hypothetical protein